MSSQQLKIGDRLKIKELGNALTASWHYFNLNDIVVITKIENQKTLRITKRVGLSLLRTTEAHYRC